MPVPDRWQPGQLLFVGFEGLTAPPDLLAQIAQGRIGGVILFGRNVGDPAQVRQLISTLRAAAPEGLPLTVAVDQEGGRVQRLRDPWTSWPPMRDVGDAGDPDRTRAVGAALAVELREAGFCLDFAPVVDVDSNPDNPVIGDRSFSRDPHLVAGQVAAFIEGMQSEGVAACAKHFPGHGDTDLDSHLDLPRLEHDLHRLRALELVPFRAAIDAGVASIMTAHVIFEGLDPRRPATLSPEVMAVLRDELGYDGLVFTDDLEMGAVAKHYSVRDRVLGPLEAGVDGLLICSKADLREEALRLVERASDAVLESAIRRVLAHKDRFGVTATPADHAGEPRDAGPPYADHRALADELRRDR